MPIFHKQIARGGPVTLTHPEMTRFIMSIEEAVRLIIDSAGLAHGGEVFITKMPEREIMWVNDSSNISGYEPHELIGKSPEILYANRDDFIKFGAELKLAIEEGRNVIFSEQLYKRKNGETFPAEIIITIHKENGEISSATGIVRDITERKLAEGKILAAEANLKSIFDI